MATLLEIQKKIQAISNSGKITKAMQLVASSKMRFFQKKAVSARDHAHDLLTILHQQMGEKHQSIFTTPRTSGPSLFIIYTSDKGLCGALNTQLLRRLFKSDEWMKKAPEDRLLITIGRKAADFARTNKIKVEKHFHGIKEKLTIIDALPILDELMAYWVEGKCREVILVAPHYKNTFVSYPVLKTFLPFSEEMVWSHMPERDKKDVFPPPSPYMIYEPDKERFMDVLFIQIIQSLFLESFFELKASEYSSRMIAMQNATDSANKIVQNLKLSYNKIRQQVITQELAELIGGSEAIS